jgi:acyl-CoA synthetase (AMP-forming)/AMP-acid ligase II
MALVAAAVAAGTWACAAYLDAKFHLRKDLSLLTKLKKGEWDYAKVSKEDKISIWYIIEDAFHKHWNERAIWWRERSWTFGEIYEQTVRYAQWLLDQGIRPGDLVALYLQNSPEFMMLWFATLCIGAAPAFLNYNLEGNALLHCLKVCETKLIIVDEELGCQRRIEGSRQEVEKSGAKIVVLNSALKASISSLPAICPGEEYRRGVQGSFPYCLIYTSGTTGLPKGCAFTIARTRLLGPHLRPYFDGKAGVDCWYNSMPLYHGTGAITSSVALLGGISIALAPKFSVSRFWNDIHDSGATFFVYVGETARYLLNAPPHPLERDHRLRCCYGNGLRPDVWLKVQERFNIPEVAEFFNSTEGMFSLLNWDKGPYQAACVGHHGAILRKLMHNVYIPVAIDHETGDIWRDPQTGFGKRTTYEEGGEIIVTIPNKEAFQGYWRAQAATDKKFAANVFKEGDLYYRSGDALRRTPDGRWYFLDRLGDTFRWKSENVSTAEVAECLGKYPGVAEANVYGVLVPSHEGRAGCAALHLEEGAANQFDHNAMLQYARERLPKYAVPTFLRVVKASTHIHNHKQNKVPLRKEGIDPNLVGTEVPDGKADVFLWLPPRGDRFVAFEERHWKELEAGQARL